MPGHGLRMIRKPPWFGPHSLPSASTTAMSMPGSGIVHDPGLVATAPGTGETMIPPVSVCHHVSTIGQRPPPMVSRYHIHASGLIGSPTLPSRRRLDMSCLAGCSSPARMNERIAVGAVYRIVTLYFSMIDQMRSGAGWFGTPSYMTAVAPHRSGPYARYVCPVTQPQSAVHQ